MILGHVGRSFCCYLSSNIIDRDMRQRILKSVTDEKALNHIRDVCFLYIFIEII